MKRLAQHVELRFDRDGAGAGGLPGRALVEQAVEMDDPGLQPQGLLAEVLQHIGQQGEGLGVAGQFLRGELHLVFLQRRLRLARCLAVQQPAAVLLAQRLLRGRPLNDRELYLRLHRVGRHPDGLVRSAALHVPADRQYKPRLPALSGRCATGPGAGAEVTALSTAARARLQLFRRIRWCRHESC